MSSGLCSRDFFIEADGERLACTLFATVQPRGKGTILSLHGAGDAIRQRTEYLGDHFSQIGFDMLALDMSGHGGSSGMLRDSTLQRRHDQALALALSPSVPTPDILMGNSMGGFVAATLLPDLAPRGVILICPALYASDAYRVPFDERFTAILRRPGSFRDSQVLRDVRGFRGAVLLIIGDRDAVIPGDVVDLYLEAFESASYVQHSVIPGAPHRIHLWAVESDRNKAAITGEIDRFLDNLPVT